MSSIRKSNQQFLRQVYLVRKIQQGQADRLGKLKTVHLFMERWYVRKLDKVQHQSWVREYQDSEKTSIYYHELRKKNIKKSDISQLMIC